MGVVNRMSSTPKELEEISLRANTYSTFLLQGLTQNGYIFQTIADSEFQTPILKQVGLFKVTHGFRLRPDETKPRLFKMKFAVGEKPALWFSEYLVDGQIEFDLEGMLAAILEELKLSVLAETLKFELEIKHSSDMAIIAKALKVKMKDPTTVSKGRVKIRYIPGRPHLAIVVFGGVREALEIAEKYSGT